MKRFDLKVKGMTCASCEVLLERGMKKVPGVQNVQVSRSKEKAVVYCEESVQLEDLQSSVADKGYVLIPKDTIDNPVRAPFIVKNKKLYSDIGSAIVIILGAYFILSQFDILPKSFGVTDNMSYGFIFIIGLVAATSTCLAVAGGLLLAIANKYSKANPHLNGWQKFKPHIYFNAGRLISYTLLGGAIGILGSFLTISASFTGAITILAGLLMIVVGLQLLQIFPWLNKIQLKMPKFFAHKIYDGSAKKKTGRLSSFLFGGATFFLPCGFTQALQLYVLSKGSFSIGALTMLAFSLGTLPSLAGIGALTSFTKGKFKDGFVTFSAVLVIILGIFSLGPGLSLAGVDLAGVDLDFSSNNIEAPIENVQIIDGKQIINLEVRGLDYYPDKFTLKQGVPVEWRVDGKGAIGCAQILSVPKLGITEQLPRDRVKIITFTPEKTGKLIFSCGMGMAGPGTFEVIA